jgi:hypothetical protein
MFFNIRLNSVYGLSSIVFQKTLNYSYFEWPKSVPFSNRTDGTVLIKTGLNTNLPSLMNFSSPKNVKELRPV